MRTWIALVAGCVAGLFSMAQGAGAATLQPVGTFSNPIYMTSPPGDPRLFVVERAGTIEVVHDGVQSQFLDIHDLTLVGNDTGGGVCQFLIDAHPERIGRLVLTNCDAFDKFPPFPFNAVFALMRSTASTRILAAAMGPKVLRHSPVGYGLLVRDPDPALTASWIKPAASDSRIAGDFAALARGIGRTDLTDVAPRLHRFTKPVRLVWGTADRCFTPELGRRLAALFPDSSMVEVPGARTFVPLDNPGAVVDAIVAVSGARAAN